MAERMPLYREALGADYDRLPAIIRAMHDVRGRHTAHGCGRVRRSTHLFGRLLATFLGMPAEASSATIAVSFTLRDGVESITRSYDGAILITHQAIAPGARGEKPLLMERFGPVKLFIRLEGDEAGVTFHLQACRLLGLPMPSVLAPRLTARERVSEGKYHYFVQVALPFLGRLIEYEGLLNAPE